MKRFLMLLGLLLSATFAHAVEVDVLFSDRYRPHVEAVQALEQNMRADDVRLFSGLENGDTTEELAQLERIIAREPDLLVVVGEDALQAAVSANVQIPTFSIMSMTLRGALQSKLPISGIDLRPSPTLVAAELVRLLPKGATVVSYYNQQYSGGFIDEAQEAFKKQGLVLDAQPWPDQDVQIMLNNSMKKADCYWMQMEYQSVSPDTLRLLFGLAKKGKVLIGLSEKYVRAGAMLAWTPNAKFIGDQATPLINRILAGEAAATIALQHPEKMKLSIRTPDSTKGGDQ